MRDTLCRRPEPAALTVHRKVPPAAGSWLGLGTCPLCAAGPPPVCCVPVMATAESPAPQFWCFPAMELCGLFPPDFELPATGSIGP